MIKLFLELVRGDLFYFGDKPNRMLIKEDKNHYVAPEGKRMIHPHVAVFPMTPKYKIRIIFDRFKGDTK
jgi:hypothetical protein